MVPAEKKIHWRRMPDIHDVESSVCLLKDLDALGCSLEGMKKQWYGWNLRASCTAVHPHWIGRVLQLAIVGALWTFAQPIAASKSTRKKERDRIVHIFFKILAPAENGSLNIFQNACVAESC